MLAWGYLFFGSEGLVAQLERRRELAALSAELEAEQARTAQMQRQVGAVDRAWTSVKEAMSGLVKVTPPDEETRALLDFQRPGEVVYIVEEEDPLLRAESEGKSED